MPFKKTYRAGLCTSTAMALTLMVGQLSAVQAAQDDGDKKGAADAMLEEIEVYGTKRSAAQKVQDVPAQISAYSANKMDAMQIVRLTDLTMSTPSVTLDDIGTVPGTPNYSIRGMGVNSSIPSIDPAVAIFMNDIYTGSGQGTILSMMDIESIEIHKGPQGVLFGRNVTGGALLLRTARPQQDFAIKAKVGYETNMKYGQGAVTGPISDNTAIRVAAYFKDDNGYFESPTMGRNVGLETTWAVRGTISHEFTENFDITVIYEHGETTGDGPVTQNALGGNPSMPFDTGETIQDFGGLLDLEWDQMSVEAIYRFDNGATFTNIFGHGKSSQFSRSDIDGGPMYLFHSSGNTDAESISNEMRFNAPLSEQWEMTAGLYYQETELDYDEGRSLFQDSALNPLVNLGLLPRVQYGGGGMQETKIFGLFLNNYVNLSEQLTLQVGARYSWNDKEAQIDPLTTCTFDYTCFATITGLEQNSDYMSAKIGLDYAVSDDMNVYTHWARSYRAGGFNFRIPLSLVLSKLGAGQSLAFEPERLDSFEVGMKSTMMDGKVRLNAAAYMNYLSDMQREINLPDPSGGVIQDIQNTGDARIFGMEFDTLISVSSNFVVNLGAGYIDGDYTDVIFDISADGVVNDGDLALDIPRLPKWTFTAGATYDFDLGDMGMLSARFDYNYRSSAAYTDNNVGRFNSYTMMNAGLTYTPVDSNWSLSVYGKNLTDEVILGGMTVLPFAAFGAPYFAPMGKGRRWGAEIRMNF